MIFGTCKLHNAENEMSFGDMFDRMPKILGVTWLRPRPLLGGNFFEPAWHSPYKAAHM